MDRAVTTGFQHLAAAIGLGEVGIVLVTEVSRLSRRNSDWHRVIELCAVFRTLIADEDGIYTPSESVIDVSNSAQISSS